MEYTFEGWLHRRHKRNWLAPEADKIMPMIAAAGATGMSRRQLGHAIDLERDVLDELLDGLVRLGLLTLADDNGIPIFRTRSAVWQL